MTDTKDTDITQLQADVQEIKTKQDLQGTKIDEMHVALVGEVKNGDKVGIQGKIALLQASLTRVWWAIFVIVGLVAWVVKMS